MSRLINAVKDAVQPVTYPDRYKGAAAYHSSIYPDRWVAETARAKKGVTHIYRNAEPPPSVPVFAKPAKQIIQEMNRLSRGPADAPTANLVSGTVYKATTSTNREPLKPPSNNKRTTPSYVDLTDSSPKRTKNEEPTQPTHRLTREDQIIDLTGGHHIQYVPTQRLPTRPALANITDRTVNSRHPGSRNDFHNPPQRPAPLDIIRDDTTAALTRCAARLRSAANSVDVDRDSLRERWEKDPGLQLQHVTDHLADLNSQFGEADQAIARALAIVENRLLKR